VTDPPSRSLQSSDTRQRILAAAERQFAERGFAGTTMRDLTHAAGTNLAAVNYHFGSKEGLLHEVFRTYLEPIGRERLDALDAAEQAAGGAPLPLRRILELYLAPAVRTLASRHSGIPSIVTRLHHEPHPAVEELIARVMQPVTARYIAAVARTLPGLDPQLILLRGHLMTGAMLYILGHGRVFMERLSAPAAPALNEDALLRHLVDFCEAGFGRDA
jgi:AcrR family transcriptional regulator